MKDENDILFNEYSIDFYSVGKAFFSGFNNGEAGVDTVSAAERSVSFFDTLVNTLSVVWNVFSVLAWLLAGLLIYGIVYAYIRHNQLGELENEWIANNERLFAELNGSRKGNQRWEDVLAHIETDNPNDWKLAIIEADIMLEEILDAAGYAGTTVGEKLKGASTNRFQTIDQAWKAHIVRNKIAHAGADFVLTKKMAQETVTQYRMVFQEFGMV
jgi:hypothetical protein